MQVDVLTRFLNDKKWGKHSAPRSLLIYGIQINLVHRLLIWNKNFDKNIVRSISLSLNQRKDVISSMYD